MIAISSKIGHLKAEFLPRAYSQIRGHLESEILNAESAFMFLSRVNLSTRGKAKNRESQMFYSCATSQNAMSSTLDVVH